MSTDHTSKNLNQFIQSMHGPYSGFADRKGTRSKTSIPEGGILVFFDAIEAQLLNEIGMADAVVGCVAWLTHFDVIAAIARKRGASIVVQKEDFLRPDVNSGSQREWRHKLRAAYESIKSLSRLNFKHVSSLSYQSDDRLDAVRCVGNHNSQRSPAFPRMHHKFLLFCSYAEGGTNGEGWDEPDRVEPYAVWTGSFNFTKNATQSLENALLIREPSIVSAYYDEWARCVAISETLDWESEWCEPEWRIGS